MSVAEPKPAVPKPKLRWLSYCLWTLLALIFACSIPWDLWLFVRPVPTPETPKPDGKRTCDEFEAAIKSYPYEAPQPRKDRIVKNYPKLAIGMSKDQVACLIGEPDCSVLIYGPKGPGEKWLGSAWTYCLRKREKGSNAYDPCVEIFFGTEDRANWIVPSNVDGLTKKGGVSRQRGSPPNTDKR